jgi:ABC-2 type transport system ATP-binding protein
VALLHKGKLILAEALDDLKAHTFLISAMFASRDHIEAPPEGRGLELIDAEDAPRQARWLVRAPDRSACEALRALPGIEGLEVETPNLEEIYIGYMRGRRPERPAPPRAVHVA